MLFGFRPLSTLFEEFARELLEAIVLKRSVINKKNNSEHNQRRNADMEAFMTVTREGPYSWRSDVKWEMR